MKNCHFEQFLHCRRLLELDWFVLFGLPKRLFLIIFSLPGRQQERNRIWLFSYFQFCPLQILRWKINEVFFSRENNSTSFISWVKKTFFFLNCGPHSLDCLCILYTRLVLLTKSRKKFFIFLKFWAFLMILPKFL